MRNNATSCQKSDDAVTMSLRQYQQTFVKIVCGSFTVIVLLLLIMPGDKLPQRHQQLGSDLRPLRLENATVDHTTTRNATDEAPQPPLFYVRSAQCKMPYVNPFTPELLEIFNPSKYESCASDEALVTPIFDANLGLYVLQINDEAGRNMLNSSENAFSCCYKQVIRVGENRSADKHFELLPCANFHQNFVVPSHIDGMLIECRSLQNTTQILQEDAFAFIQHRNSTNLPNRTEQPMIRKPSVLMVGIDSVSRINLRRAMPETFEFLSRNNWYEMQGYNKIEDNTFPNLIAALTGFNLTTAQNVCMPKKVGGLDQCPFMWKRFKNMGYRTAYAEDTCYMNTFNYDTVGFKEPPVDYYLRPFMLAITDKLKQSERWGMTHCQGRRHASSYIYDYCQEFANRFSEEPIFGLFWSNHFSHNYFENPAAMDHKMREYFEGFERSGVLETSIVIFLSDHGMRWGSLLQLAEGFLEERLPMLFIWLPQWFRTQYPLFARSLDLNRNRLTSPYDLYMTLQHIAALGTRDMELQSAQDCPQCQTLLRPVPFNRSCIEAGITEHWCTCHPYEIVTKQTNSEIITNLVIEKMNAYLQTKNLSGICSNIALSSVRSVEKKLVLDENMQDKVDVEHTYRIKFETKPNDGSFQATVVYNDQDKTLQVDVESISRLNSYENDSKCVVDKQAKKYCFCRT